MDKIMCAGCGKMRGSVRENRLCGYCDKRINGIDKTCSECGATFHTHSNRQTMCDDCKLKAKGVPGSLTCPVCGYECSSVAGYKTHTKTHEDGYIRRQFSEESRRRMSESAKARTDRGPISESHRQAIIRSNRTRAVSEETKRRISDSNKGKVMSDEAKAKMSEAQKRRFESDPTLRLKMGEYSRMSGRKGSHMSDESKRRLSESQKRRFREHPELRTRQSEMAKARSTEKLKATKRKGWTEDACRFCDDESFATSILDELASMNDGKGPTMIQIQDRLGTYTGMIGKAINKFGLRDRVHRTRVMPHSQKECELYQFVSSHYDGKILRSTRSVIKPKELDIYLPEQRLAIEFDGAYWHSAKLSGRYSQLDKTMMCDDLGIRLIHVSESDWMARRGMIEQCIIRSIFGHENPIRRDEVTISVLSADEIQQDRLVNRGLGCDQCVVVEVGGDTVSMMPFTTVEDVVVCEPICDFGTRSTDLIIDAMCAAAMRSVSASRLIGRCDLSHDDPHRYSMFNLVGLTDPIPTAYSPMKVHGNTILSPDAHGKFLVFDCGDMLFEID